MDLNNTNMTRAAAQQADLVDPGRQGLNLARRVRAMRGDFTEGKPLVLSPLVINLGTNPTTTDFLVLGGETYEFVTAAGTVAADANIAVAIGANAAATFLNFAAAVNGTAAAAHPNILDSGGGAALGRGTKPVFADDLGSSVLALYYTGTQGVDPDAMTHEDMKALPSVYPSFVVSESMTAVVTWNALNFNLLPVANPITQVNGTVGLRLAVTTAMVSEAFRFRFPGVDTIAGVIVSPKTSTGIPKYYDAATFQITAGQLIVTLAATGAVDPANGDVIDLLVFGQRVGVVA